MKKTTKESIQYPYKESYYKTWYNDWYHDWIQFLQTQFSKTIDIPPITMTEVMLKYEDKEYIEKITKKILNDEFNKWIESINKNIYKLKNKWELQLDFSKIWDIENFISDLESILSTNCNNE